MFYTDYEYVRMDMARQDKNNICIVFGWHSFFFITRVLLTTLKFKTYSQMLTE